MKIQKALKMRHLEALCKGLLLVLLGAGISGCRGTQLLHEVSDFQTSLKGAVESVRDF
jgi:hypothetical protein